MKKVPTRQRGQRVRLLAALAFCLLVAAGAGAAQAIGPRDQQGPVPITVSIVQEADVADKVEFVGRIEAIEHVDVHARVEGFLQSLNFREGDDVERGDLLYVIEPDQFQAAVDQAKAQVASARAALRNAELTLQRRQELFKNRNVSQADLDKAIADRGAAAAALDSARAALRVAELNFGYTHVMAPISGRIGRSNFTQGNLVGPDSGALARIVQLEPIRVVFSISEQDFISIVQRTHGEGEDQVKANYIPSLRLPNGTNYPETGEMDFVANEMDPSTGTVPVRVRFPNPRRELLPGGTVVVSIRPAQSRRKPLVPVQAVQENRHGKYVLVVGPDNKVEERPIKVSGQAGQSWVVEEGLQQGERVIVEGLQKVRPGVLVQTAHAEVSKAQ